jgi:hypothetical protein
LVPPHRATVLEALREQTQTIPIPPQQLDTIPVPTAKGEQLTRVRVLAQFRLHDRGQPIKVIAQISHTARQPDVHATRRSDHRAAAGTSRTIRASPMPRTRTQPPARSISMMPSADGALTRTAANLAGLGATFPPRAH